MRTMRRSQTPAPGGGPRWWRTRRGYVLGPLVTGLALCALGLWSVVVYQHDQAASGAPVVPATAVIDQIYASAPTQGYGPSTFDQYALVHFEAQGRTARAQVLLVAGCKGACIPQYQVGQVLTVYYSPGNPSYAELTPPARGASAGFLFPLTLFGLLGAVFLVAAVINMVTAPAADNKDGSRHR